MYLDKEDTNVISVGDDYQASVPVEPDNHTELEEQRSGALMTDKEFEQSHKLPVLSHIFSELDDEITWEKNEAISEIIRFRLTQSMVQGNFTEGDVSRFVGISKSVLSKWINRNYQGDDKDIINKISQMYLPCLHCSKRQRDDDGSGVHAWGERSNCTCRQTPTKKQKVTSNTQTPIQLDDIRDVCRTAMKDKGLTQVAVSLQVGILQSVLSQWLKGNYKGNNHSVEEKIRNWLASRPC